MLLSSIKTVLQPALCTACNKNIRDIKVDIVKWVYKGSRAPISNNKDIVKTLSKKPRLCYRTTVRGHGLQVDFSSHHCSPCTLIRTVYVQLRTNSRPSIRIKTAVFTHGILFLWAKQIALYTWRGHRIFFGVIYPINLVLMATSGTERQQTLCPGFST